MLSFTNNSPSTLLLSSLSFYSSTPPPPLSSLSLSLSYRSSLVSFLSLSLMQASLAAEVGASVTGGLVQNARMAVLPTVIPAHAFGLWFIASLLPMRRVWRDPAPRQVCFAVSVCMLSA